MNVLSKLGKDDPTLNSIFLMQSFRIQWHAPSFDSSSRHKTQWLWWKLLPHFPPSTLLIPKIAHLESNHPLLLVCMLLTFIVAIKLSKVWQLLALPSHLDSSTANLHLLPKILVCLCLQESRKMKKRGRTMSLLYHPKCLFLQLLVKQGSLEFIFPLLSSQEGQL